MVLRQNYKRLRCETIEFRNFEADNLNPHVLSEDLKYTVLLYYRFIPIPDTDAIIKEQEEICEKFNLRGRILVAPEGINGTVSGLHDDAQKYMEFMKSHPGFDGIEFKIDKHDQHVFNKTHVRFKPEIVHFGFPDLPVALKADNYVEPDEWLKMMNSNDEDVVILDARSKYETEVGKFKGAVTLDIDNFRELPEKLDELEQYKDKKIYTYCTGGIKCEKVSAWMKENGFENVFQLHGGIVRYGHEVGGEGFEGSCYVFDQRVVVPVNDVDPSVIGNCKICGAAETERMINCANADCNDHFLICDSCLEKNEGCCSAECMESPKRRVFDGRGYYLRGENSKVYVKDSE